MKTITPQTLQARLEADDRPYIIDLRPVNHECLPVDLHMSFEDIQAGYLPPVSKDTVILIVCPYGRVSELAGAYLQAVGFLDVYHLAGGTSAWQQLMAC